MPPKRQPLSVALGQHKAEPEPAAPEIPAEPVAIKPEKRTSSAGTKGKTVQQTVYLSPAAHEQLRKIAFDERVKMHDILMEGLNLAFERRGLPRTTDLA